MKFSVTLRDIYRHFDRSGEPEGSAKQNLLKWVLKHGCKDLSPPVRAGMSVQAGISLRTVDDDFFGESIEDISLRQAQTDVEIISVEF